jgi:hypothetical protein
MWGLGQDTLLGIVVGLCGGLGRHTSLGIVVSLCGASGNALYWVLLLVYVGASGDTLHWVLLLAYVEPRATHLTGYCWFMWHLGQHTLLGIVGLCGVLLLVMLRLGQLHTLLAIVVGL